MELIPRLNSLWEVVLDLKLKLFIPPCCCSPFCSHLFHKVVSRYNLLPFGDSLGCRLSNTWSIHAKWRHITIDPEHMPLSYNTIGNVFIFRSRLHFGAIGYKYDYDLSSDPYISHNTIFRNSQTVRTLGSISAATSFLSGGARALFPNSGWQSSCTFDTNPGAARF